MGGSLHFVAVVPRSICDGSPSTNKMTIEKKESDVVSKLYCESETTHFIEWFRFGVLLGIELAQD